MSEEECGACGECVEGCQLHALKLRDDAIHLDGKKCIGCGICASVCPVEAITLTEREDFHGVTHDAYLDLSLHVAGSRKLI